MALTERVSAGAVTGIAIETMSGIYKDNKSEGRNEEKMSLLINYIDIVFVILFIT